MLWHYTTGQKFLQILESGEIRPAFAGVPDGELPIVWFSSNQFWEKTACKGWQESDGSILSLTMEETRKLGGGLFRIGVSGETAPHDWLALKLLSGMKSGMARRMGTVALRHNARPEEWFGTFEAVSVEKWAAVEVYQDGQWCPIPFERGIATTQASGPEGD
jgi:hypothetical protein